MPLSIPFFRRSAPSFHTITPLRSWLGNLSLRTKMLSPPIVTTCSFSALFVLGNWNVHLAVSAVAFRVYVMSVLSPFSFMPFMFHLPVTSATVIAAGGGGGATAALVAVSAALLSGFVQAA